jgi:hypothetical protein
MKRFCFWLAPLLVFIVLGGIFGPSLLQHMQGAAVPHYFNDDAGMHIPPYFNQHDPELFQQDYLTKYIKACHPLGYRWLYNGLSRWLDPTSISKGLPYILWGLFMVAVGWGVYAATGWLGALVAIALAMSGDLFLEKAVGAFPRAFAFPILALGVSAFLRGRIGVLAVAVVLGAAFYPAVAVSLGLTLAIGILLPASWRGSPSPSALPARVALLVGTGVLTLALLVPNVLATRPYGDLLAPDRYAEYPEAGSDGRSGSNERFDYAQTWPQLFCKEAMLALVNEGTPWCPAAQRWLRNASDWWGTERVIIAIRGLWIFLVVGLLSLALFDRIAVRLLIWLVLNLLLYQSSILLVPHLFMPQRHVIFALPLFIILALPLAAAGWTRLVCFRFNPHAGRGATETPLCSRVARPAIMLATGISVLVLFGGGINASCGLTCRPHDVRDYQFLQTLPKSAVIAAWPAAASAIPYLAQRQTFLSYELHQVYQQKYADEMRRRFGRLLQAYWPENIDDVLALFRKEGVTHLMIDRRHYERMPSYFSPFQDAIVERWQRLAPTALAVLTNRPAAIIFEVGPQLVIDLTRLDKISSREDLSPGKL